MKKLFLFGLLTILLCCCAGIEGHASYSTTGSIAIVEVISDGCTSTQQNKDLTRYMVQITEQTFKSEILIMMRENVQPLLIKGAVLEQCEDECLIQVGKSINAAYITQAFITKSEDSFLISAELYDIASGRKVAEATNEVGSESSIQRGIFLSVAQMYNQFISAVQP